MTWLPFVLHWSRPAIVAAILCLPRKHPCRELAVAALVLAAIDVDLLDGAVVRALGMANRWDVYWSDHIADVVAILGAIVIVGARLTLRRDPPPRSHADARRAFRRAAFFWGTTLVLLAGAGFLLMLRRMTPGG